MLRFIAAIYAENGKVYSTASLLPVLQTLSKLFWSCCVVYPNLLFPRCPLHALDNAISNAVGDRVRVVRLENYRQKQINGVRFNMSENVHKRGTEYSD